jgi:hypothetical protein
MAGAWQNKYISPLEKANIILDLTVFLEAIKYIVWHTLENYQLHKKARWH